MMTPAPDTTAPLNPPHPPSHPLTASSIRTVYRTLAPVYDWVFGACFEAGRRKAIEWLESAPGDRVLEVGVGTGLSLRHWHGGAQVTGIDLSPEMLAHAERNRQRHGLDQARLMVMDAQATNFPDSHFDKIAAMYVVSVVPDVPALLREMRRICRPGGRIAIVNHFEATRPSVRAFERAFNRYSGWLGFNPSLPLSTVTHAPGLAVRRIESVNWGGYWTLVEAENVK